MCRSGLAVDDTRCADHLRKCRADMRRLTFGVRDPGFGARWAAVNLLRTPSPGPRSVMLASRPGTSVTLGGKFDRNVQMLGEQGG
jgi:hypothetical protein